VTVTAALTQLIYPYFYDFILAVQPAILVVLTLRNLMFFVILGWTIFALWRDAHPADSELDAVPLRVWPFRVPSPTSASRLVESGRTVEEQP
jgi:hypothetical protein